MGADENVKSSGIHHPDRMTARQDGCPERVWPALPVVEDGEAVAGTPDPHPEKKGVVGSSPRWRLLACTRWGNVSYVGHPQMNWSSGVYK